MIEVAPAALNPVAGAPVAFGRHFCASTPPSGTKRAEAARVAVGLTFTRFSEVAGFTASWFRNMGLQGAPSETVDEAASRLRRARNGLRSTFQGGRDLARLASGIGRFTPVRIFGCGAGRAVSDRLEGKPGRTLSGHNHPRPRGRHRHPASGGIAGISRVARPRFGRSGNRFAVGGSSPPVADDVCSAGPFSSGGQGPPWGKRSRMGADPRLVWPSGPLWLHARLPRPARRCYHSCCLLGQRGHFPFPKMAGTGFRFNRGPNRCWPRRMDPKGDGQWLLPLALERRKSKAGVGSISNHFVAKKAGGNGGRRRW